MIWQIVKTSSFKNNFLSDGTTYLFQAVDGKSLKAFVLEENNLLAEETFFIDDTLENTEAAEQLGIRSWNIDPEKEDVVNLAEKLGI